MCTRYVSPEAAAIERQWKLGRDQPFRGLRAEVFPRRAGPYIRVAGEGDQARLEVQLGQWWLIADGASERFPKAMTCNARWEDLRKRWSYRGPWARGQRCIIPAEAFYEPNWESGRHVPWCFRRADGDAWALAGLWNDWVEPSTGEVIRSYTMLTQNADDHPLMRRMHKPDPNRGLDAQDKRCVVPLAPQDEQTWLFGSAEQAASVVSLPPLAWFDASPAPAPTAADKPALAGARDGAVPRQGTLL